MKASRANCLTPVHCASSVYYRRKVLSFRCLLFSKYSKDSIIPCVNLTLLTLNSSKTEVWILAHRTEKPTCQNKQLFTRHLPLCSKPWFYLWRTSYIFSDQITYLSLRPVTITFVNFAVSGLTSIRQLPVPLLRLSFTPNLITVILSTINFLSLNYPVSSSSRSLLLVLSLKLPCPVISLPFYGPSTGWKSLNASNTNSS